MLHILLPATHFISTGNERMAPETQTRNIPAYMYLCCEGGRDRVGEIGFVGVCVHVWCGWQVGLRPR